MKYFMLLAIALASQSSYAQWTTSGTNIYNSNSGNVGVGTTSPSEKLHINGNINFSGNDRKLFLGGGVAGSTFGIAFSSSYPTYGIFYKEGGPDFVSISPNGLGTNGVMNIFGDNRVGIAKNNPAYTLDVNGTINATALYVNGAPFSGSSQWTTSGSNINYNSGIVSIGTATAPAGYKLAIGGKVVAEEVVVKLQSNWPDYVFDEEYKLPSLSEVEAYIRMHKHLPGVPTAKQVEEQGLSLGEMNAVLLKKIEELTLLLIDQQKQIDALKKSHN